MEQTHGTLLGDEHDVQKYYFENHKELFFDLPSTIYDFLGSIASEESSNGTIQPNELACRTIFVRILQDLRCVQICASSGYTPAAAAIATSIIELAYEISYLAAHIERAEKWFNHRDLRHTSEEHHNRVRVVLKSQTADVNERKTLEDVEWENYWIMSAIKHGNSVYQQMFGYEIEGEAITFSAIPTQSEIINNTSSLILYRACQYSLRAGIYFANSFLSNDLRKRHEIELLSITERLRVATDKALPTLKETL